MGTKRASIYWLLQMLATPVIHAELYEPGANGLPELCYTSNLHCCSASTSAHGASYDPEWYFYDAIRFLKINSHARAHFKPGDLPRKLRVPLTDCCRIYCLFYTAARVHGFPYGTERGLEDGAREFHLYFIYMYMSTWHATDPTNVTYTASFVPLCVHRFLYRYRTWT
jgi:hypothetical protein